MTKSKHVPQRTCIGCRTAGNKRAFVRVVRTPEGTVTVDPTGKQNGRGAYICERVECWETAVTKDRLAKALRTGVSAVEREELRRYGERFRPDAVAVGS